MGLPTLTPTDIGISLLQQKKDYRTLAGLDEYTSNFGVQEITHLLKRTMFSCSIDDINYFKTKTLTQAVDELIDNNFLPTSFPVNDYNEYFVDPNVAPGQTWINAPTISDNDFWRAFSFKKWHIGQMINQPRSIQLKMMLFLHNHFATHMSDVFGSKMKYNHHMYFRNNATGNFKSITKFITTDPIMLQYLGGEYSNKYAPNENYARELQELFCIGKGPNSHYTEDDIKEAARLLTGWKVNYDTNEYYFQLDDHDTENKFFSSFYNNTVILGRNDVTAGETELDELLNMLFLNNECALFICRKLYRWFVYYEIDTETENNVIIPLANILRTNNYELKPVLKVLFKSQHFFDPINYGAQIKSPIDFIIGLMREFKVTFPSTSDYLSNYKLWESINYYSSNMNQEYGEPPNVAGWFAYYQAPQFYETWINATTYPKRVDFAKAMIEYGIFNNNSNIVIDVINFAKATSNPADPNILISESLEVLYKISISTASQTALKVNTLLDGQQTDGYWSGAWFNYIDNPTNDIYKSIVETRLKSLYRFILNSPEYQLA